MELAFSTTTNDGKKKEEDSLATNGPRTGAWRSVIGSATAASAWLAS